jgi:SAM-dependent methyltransferase
MTRTLSRPLMLLRQVVRTVETDGFRAAIAYVAGRVVGTIRNHGFGGTLRRQPEAPATEVPDEPTPPETHPFDLRYGTDTSGCLPGAVLPPTSLSALLIAGYIGISPSALIQAIAALPIQHQRFTFVDLGCGKGRALLVAAQFPFRRLLGVELAPELCRTAQQNIAIRPEWAERISVLEHDAATVSLPEGPLVIFMFHPFYARILRRVLANLERQLRRNPRETWLLYANNPRFPGVMERFPFLREISETRYPLSPEDTAANVFERPYERFTLYRAQLEL